MQLDNEKQRAQLLQILESISLQGTRKQMMESLTELNGLVGAISAATLEEIKVFKDGPESEGN
jgi:hypothetical protein